MNIQLKPNGVKNLSGVRRVADIQEDLTGKNVYLEFSHDDDAIIYINGIKVVDTGNACKKNERVKLSEEVVASLKPGENLIAGYCHNRVGNGLLDFGLLVEWTATVLSIKQHNKLL